MDEPLIREIYEAAIEPERWNPLLERLSNDLDGAAVYLGQSHTERFGDGDFWTFGVDPGEWRRFGELAQSARSNPTLAALLSSEGRVVDRRAIIPDALVGKDRLSRVFLAEKGLFHAAVSVVQRDAEMATTFWAARDRARPIEGEPFARLGAVAPHLGQAMRIHRRLGLRAGAGFEVALDALGRGVAVLDVSLRLLYANAAAERALEGRRGLSRRLGRLTVEAPGARRALEDLARRLTDPRGDLAGGEVLVPDAGGVPAWRVALAPAIGAAYAGVGRNARIVAFIDDLAGGPRDPEPREIAARLGLSPAESRVAALSARALRPGEIASALGVSVNTVKSHLKSVHARLGVRSQAELVRMILSLR